MDIHQFEPIIVPEKDTYLRNTVALVFTIMDLIDGMRTFVATVESRSFTAGAERLGISKKLASKYVAKLEERLGIRLLNRSTRSLSLTDQGQKYYDGCIGLLSDLDMLESDLKSKSGSLKGTLRIAAPLDFGRVVVLPSISKFTIENPDVVIEVHMNDRFVDIVDEGYDLAIRVGEHPDSSLVSRLLGRLEIWLVGAPSLFHTQDEPASPGDLAPFPCLQDLNFRSGGIWQFRRGQRTEKFAPKANIHINSAQAIRDLAISGYGLARCPDVFVAKDVKEGRLRRLLPEYKIQSSEIRILFASSKHLQKTTRAFADFLIREYQTGSFRNSDYL